MSDPLSCSSSRGVHVRRGFRQRARDQRDLAPDHDGFPIVDGLPRPVTAAGLRKRGLASSSCGVRTPNHLADFVGRICATIMRRLLAVMVGR